MSQRAPTLPSRHERVAPAPRPKSLFAPAHAIFGRLAWIPVGAVVCLTAAGAPASAGSLPPPPPNPDCAPTASDTGTLTTAINRVNSFFPACTITLTGNPPIDATTPQITTAGPTTITNSGTSLTLTGNQGLILNGTRIPDGGPSVVEPAIVFLADTGVTTNTGTTSLLNGTLRAGAVNAFSPNSDYVLAAPGMSLGRPFQGGQIDLNGYSQVIGSLGGAGTVANLASGTSATLTVGADNASTTFSGSLSETSGTTGVLALAKTGAGTFTLTGLNNTYSGGTLISGGTLQLGDGVSNGNAGTGAIVDNAALVLNQGSAYTLANAISGTGTLTQIGPGTVTLTGASTYTGATLISSGTLQLGASNALPSGTALTIKSAGTFDLNGFNQTLGSVSGSGNITLGIGRLFTGFDNSSTTYSGVISGTGGLTKGGTGAFTLGGVNTYSGTTFIQSGTLALTNGSAAGTGTIAMSPNTTLAFIGTGYTFANPIQFIGPSTADPTIDSGAGSVTASGTISGDGPLTKIGSGTLILTGVSTYTGNTFVNQGTLEVDGSIASSPVVTLASGTSLTGTGAVNSVTALAGSTLMPGSAANPYLGMSALGNLILAPGSNYVVNMTPTQVASLTVGGTATISGANLTTLAAPGMYNTYGRYTLLTAQGGLTGTFGNANFSGFSGLQPEVTYDADHAYLQFVLPDQTPFALGDSLKILAGDRQGQLVTNRVLASILGGFNEQINCTNCISGFGSVGSFSAGVHGRFGLTDDIYVFGGLAFAHYNSGGADVTQAPIGVLAVRYDFTELGSSRPFVEVGGEASPWQRVNYSRPYAFGSVSGTGTGSTNSANYATYAKLGWVYRFTPQDEAAIATEIWRGWQPIGGYAEAASPVDPVPGQVRSSTDIMNIAKIGAQWTHLWTGVLDSKLETQVNLGVARSFDSHTTVGASFSPTTVLTGTEREHSWAEYGLRAGYRFSRSSILDVFVDGTLGPKPIGNTIHFGTGYRYSF